MTWSSGSADLTEGVKIAEYAADLVVNRRELVADEVVSLELVDPAGAELPTWEPGAHIALLLEEGRVRQYSLCGDAQDRHTWRIAVQREPNGRGGSEYVHRHLSDGATVRVEGPRNFFPLVDSARYLFIAGGIGITPLLAMLRKAESVGSDWQQLYLGRHRSEMPFERELSDAYGDRVIVWPSGDNGRFDLASALATPSDDTLIYCCGPEPLIAAVEACSSHWPEGALRIERFSAKAATADADVVERFQVVCRRSGVTVGVGAEESILEALEDAAVPIMSSCLEGLCRTCETAVLEGAPDHRDSILSEAERTSGNIILPCVSRSRTEQLVLDL